MESSNNYVRCEVPGVIDCYTTREGGKELFKIINKINDSSAEESFAKFIIWIVKYPVHILYCFFIDGGDPDDPGNPGGSPPKTKNEKKDFLAEKAAKKLIWIADSLRPHNLTDLRILFADKNKITPTSLPRSKSFKKKKRLDIMSLLPLIALITISLFLISPNVNLISGFNGSNWDGINNDAREIPEEALTAFWEPDNQNEQIGRPLRLLSTIPVSAFKELAGNRGLIMFRFPETKLNYAYSSGNTT